MFERKAMVVTVLIFCFCFMPSFIALAQEESVSAEAPAVEPEAAASVEPAAEPATEPAEAPAVEPAVEPVAEPVAQAPIEGVIVKPEEPSTQWLWGEVVSVDQEKKELVVKHMDYESYEDVNTTVKTDDATMFENVENLSAIKAGDRVTLDYKVKDGSNMAELLVVEKEEPAAATQVTPVPAAEVIGEPTLEVTEAPVAEVAATPAAVSETPVAGEAVAPAETPAAPAEVPAEQPAQ